ncbi:nuclear transport factor 2 family protein [Bailinhaonella thermotolerans]|uniref:nuclear transport factor 2 family protein n=1 Tax=Bailinhaonella thermotolerans TaxID=1070861 RepID=UPI00192A5FA4|nr:nuclear transport factor 2 family protein [Bailinhaonella thermotolerans]
MDGSSVIDVFIEAINTREAGARTALLRRSLTADVVFWGPLGRRVGRQAVEDFITEVVQGHPAGPCRFSRTTGVDAPEEWARFGWRFEGGDGVPLLTGMDVVHLTPRGAIDQIVVFAGTLN